MLPKKPGRHTQFIPAGVLRAHLSFISCQKRLPNLGKYMCALQSWLPEPTLTRNSACSLLCNFATHDMPQCVLFVHPDCASLLPYSTARVPHSAFRACTHWGASKMHASRFKRQLPPIWTISWDNLLAAKSVLASPCRVLLLQHHPASQPGWLLLRTVLRPCTFLKKP